MKIQVEILEKDGNGYRVSNTEIFSIGTKTNRINTAKDRLRELKSTLTANQKIRVLEWNNDEPDETRQPCKILLEG